MQGRSLPGGAVGAMKSIARFRLIRSAAGVVAVTPGLGTAIADRYGVDPARIHVVANGVDSALFHPMERETARADLGLGGGATICFVGNLVRWQGIDTLVKAIPMTAGDTSFLIVGDARTGCSSSPRRTTSASRLASGSSGPSRTSRSRSTSRPPTCASPRSPRSVTSPRASPHSRFTKISRAPAPSS